MVTAACGAHSAYGVAVLPPLQKAGLHIADLTAAAEVFCQARRYALERQAVPVLW